MTTYTNNAEGGTDGQTVTQGNSGGTSGKAFVAVDISTDGTATYATSSSVHGSLGYALSGIQGATNARTRFRWPAVVSGSKTFACRFYFRFQTVPTDASNFFVLSEIFDDTDNVILTLGVNPSKNIGFTDSTNTATAFASSALADNTWYRAEVQGTIGTTTANGQVSVSCYVLDGRTPIETWSVSNADLGTNTVGYPVFGKCTSMSPAVDRLDLDDMAFTSDSASTLGPPAGTLVKYDFDDGQGVDGAVATAVNTGASFVTAPTSTTAVFDSVGAETGLGVKFTSANSTTTYGRWLPAGQSRSLSFSFHVDLTDPGDGSYYTFAVFRSTTDIQAQFVYSASTSMFALNDTVTSTTLSKFMPPGKYIITGWLMAATASTGQYDIRVYDTEHNLIVHAVSTTANLGTNPLASIELGVPGPVTVSPVAVTIDTIRLQDGVSKSLWQPDTSPSPVAVGIKGRSTLSTASDNSSITIDPADSLYGDMISDDDWMVAIITGSASTNQTIPTPGSDWVTLRPFTQTGGSSGTFWVGAYAKIRQSGETTYTWSASNDTNGLRGWLYFGSGADTDIAHWSSGIWNDRSVTGTSTTNVAAGVSTLSDDALALVLSCERTGTAETVDQITIDGGFTKWRFDTGSESQTALIASQPLIAESNLADCTVTYPNPHLYNGSAGMLVIPAAGSIPTPTEQVTLKGRSTFGSDPSGDSITIDPFSTGYTGDDVADGDWMVLVLTTPASDDVMTPTPGSGWITLHDFAAVGSTMCFGAYAKIRQSGETKYTWSATTGANSLYGQLFWGGGGDPMISNWVTNAWATRSASGSTLTNVAPSVTTTVDDTLALMLSIERTTAAETEAQITMTNFDKWGYALSFDTTVVAGTKYLATPGDTNASVIAYPNPHDTNGIAGILAIPPAPTVDPTPQVIGSVTGGSGDTSGPFVITPDASCNDGDWIVATVAIVADSGCTEVNTVDKSFEVLVPLTTSGTGVYTVLRKKRLAGETSYTLGGWKDDATYSDTLNLTRGIAFWVRGADDDGWVVGDTEARPNDTTVVAPSITTTVDNTLAIAATYDRSVGTGTLITDPPGWTRINYSDEDGYSSATTYMAYKKQASVGATGDAVVTYSTTNGTNGNGVQVGIPPVGSVPAFRAGATYSTSGSSDTSLSLTVPDVVQSGDYGIVTISYSTGSPSETFTAPAGWVELLPVTEAYNMRTTIWGKQYSDADGTTVTFAVNTSNAYHVVGAWFDGSKVGGVETIGDYGSDTADTTDVTAPAVTAVEANRRVVDVFTMRKLGTPLTFVSATTGSEVYSDSSTNTDTNGTGVAYVEYVDSDTAIDANTATYSGTFHNKLGIQFVMSLPTLPPTDSGIVTTSMVTDMTQDSLRLGVVLGSGSSAEMIVSPTSDLSDPLAFTSPMTIAASGWATGYTVGLGAGTEYYVGVKVDGVLQTDVTHKAKTLHTAGQPASFVAGTGSCQANGSNPAVYQHVVADGCEFFAHQGDFHYADATDLATWRSAMTTAASTSNTKLMLTSMPFNYCWDNHDRIIVGALNTGTTDPAISTAWRELAGNDFPESTPGKAVYKTWVSGRIRFIHTDAWTERSSSDDPESSSKVMFGATQVQWLKDTLAAAEEPIVIWFCSFPNHRVGNGRWNSFETERLDIDNWIHAHPSVLERLIMIGGDSHDLRADSGSRTEGLASDGYPPQNFIHVPSLNASGIRQGGGTWVTGNWDIIEAPMAPGRGVYSRLTFDDNGQRVVFTWDAVQDDGSVLATWTRTVGTPTIDGVPATIGYWNGSQSRMIPASFDDDAVDNG